MLSPRLFVRAEGKCVVPQREMPIHREGDWFAVPLQSGGYGVGVIARLGVLSDALGYFFGPRRDTVPRLHEVAALPPANAVWVAMFTTMGFDWKTWQRIGHDAHWQREAFAVPRFFGQEGDRDASGRLLHCAYAYDDTLSFVRPVSPQTIAEEEYERLPRNSIYYPAAAEAMLTRLLTDAAHDLP